MSPLRVIGGTETGRRSESIFYSIVQGKEECIVGRPPTKSNIEVEPDDNGGGVVKIRFLSLGRMQVREYRIPLGGKEEIRCRGVTSNTDLILEVRGVPEDGVNKEQAEFFPFPFRLFVKLGKENRVEWPER
jgi:hypothetical protein